MATSRKKKLLIYFSIIIMLSFILSLYLIIMPCWNSPQTYTIKRAAKKTISTQNYPIWGLDISHHNGKVNWPKLVITKPHFVFIKATEGVTIKDREFDSNWVYLKKHQITRGAYHFFSYKSTGKMQAESFISNVTLEKGDLPPVLDLEFSRKMPSAKKLKKEVLSWIDIVEKHYKKKPIIYCSWRYYQKYLKNVSKDYLLWICNYRSVPNDKIHWSFWQHSESFKIPGINNQFDRNVFRYDSTAFNRILIN